MKLATLSVFLSLGLFFFVFSQPINAASSGYVVATVQIREPSELDSNAVKADQNIIRQKVVQGFSIISTLGFVSVVRAYVPYMNIGYGQLERLSEI